MVNGKLQVCSIWSDVTEQYAELNFVSMCTYDGIMLVVYKHDLVLIHCSLMITYVTHKAVRPGARPHVPPVMAEGDFRLMTPLYDNLQ